VTNEGSYVVVLCDLQSEVLKDRSRGKLRSEAEKDVGALLDKTWAQIRKDALIGSFGEFAQAVFGPENDRFKDGFKSIEEDSARIRPEYDAADLDKGILPFRLELNAKYFLNLQAGLQHLVNVLCGDLFGRALLDIRGQVQVRGVDLGQVGKTFETHYRQRSNDIKGIRSKFKLDDAEAIYGSRNARLKLPLLAFSVKPRNGLDRITFKRIAIGVLKAGFNLVEVDVRNIDFWDEQWRDTYHEVAKVALGITSHVARFSLNLSAPGNIALDMASKFADLHNGSGPWVVKVDGGLDGLSTIQALRTMFVDRQPIITCYPILDSVLTPRIGASTFRDMLIASGVDIIYPGGAPRIGSGDYVDIEHAERGYRNYWKLITRGWPMPSIAGGVHAGQLPTYYEMFGPNIAFFIGGGVAAHRNGAYFDSNHSQGWSLTNQLGLSGRRKPELGKLIKVDQAVGGAELCRFAVEAIALSNDEDELFNQLSEIRNHYVSDQNENVSPGLFEYQTPRNFMTSVIRPYNRILG